MARGKSKTNNETKATLKDVEAKFNGLSNTVVLRAEIKRVLYDSPKCNKYAIAVPSATSKGNVSYAFLNLTEFETDSEPLEVGTLVNIEGHLASSSYEKDGRKLYTTDIIADKIEEI